MGRSKKNVAKAGVAATLKKGPATISKNEKVASIAYGNNMVEFHNQNDYLEFLREKEECTSRAMVDANDVRFFVPTEKQETTIVKSGYPLELIEDAKAHTGLCVKIGNKTYPVNNAAMSSIKRMTYQRWESADPKAKAAFINATLCASESQKNVQDQLLPSICNGALYSLMTGVYSPIISHEYIGRALEIISNSVGEYALKSASCSIATYRVAIEFTGERAREMEELYRERVKDLAERRGLKIDDDVLENLKISFGVSIVNNDNGEDAATITPVFHLGQSVGFKCPDDKAVKYTAYHKGTLNFDDFDEKVEGMFAMFENFVIKLSNLITKDIKNGRVVLAEVCKQLAVPDAVTNKLIVDFAAKYNHDMVTAYDIAMMILDSVEIYRTEQDPSENALENYEARIAGVINVDMTKYDFDPMALENELKSQYIMYPINVLQTVLMELGAPKAVSKTVVDGFEAKINMEAMLGNEMQVTAWDLYQAVLGAAAIYRDFLANRKMSGDKEKRAAAFEKKLQKAKDICYVKYDVA